VSGNEVGPRNAIAVEKDAIGPAARENGAIANLAGTKSVIRMPHVFHRKFEARGCRLQDIVRGGVRAIVRNDDLESSVVLPREPLQHCIERIHTIVGRHDDGDLVAHGILAARPTAIERADLPWLSIVGKNVQERIYCGLPKAGHD
jgi:hypothetical protein